MLLILRRRFITVVRMELFGRPYSINISFLSTLFKPFSFPLTHNTVYRIVRGPNE